MFKGGLNARLNSLCVAPPKMEKGPKSAPKFFSDSFQFLAESCVLQPPLCIKKPLCEAVFRVLAGSCTQNSTPFHIFSFFMKTHNTAGWSFGRSCRFDDCGRRTSDRPLYGAYPKIIRTTSVFLSSETGNKVLLIRRGASIFCTN